MTRRVSWTAGGLALAVLGAGALAVSGATRVGVASAGGAVVASAVLVAGAWASVPRPAVWREPWFERAVRGQPVTPEGLPAALEQLDRLVSFRLSTAGDVHYRLRPILREIAAHRLRVEHGIDLDRSPEAARRLLGEAAFEVVRPGRPGPRDRSAPGLALADLEGIVDRLEAL
jgi:hypothetical protein